LLSDDRDISKTSKSVYFNCHQNISEGWMPLGIQSIPSTLPRASWLRSTILPMPVWMAKSWVLMPWITGERLRPLEFAVNREVVAGV